MNKKLKMACFLCLSAFVLASCNAKKQQNDRKRTEDDLLWWQKCNAYEIYVNSFQDSDGDGYGDLNGIRSRLDYLKQLGVKAVWLTPVYASPMKDNGYDVADYYAINERYGTMEDMNALIEEAGRMDIRIVMDLVFNHTSDQNQWFIQSARSKDNEYSDWYIWRDGKEDGSAPNNWRSIFGGSAWAWNEERQQYYLHTFAESQPDLNWENPDVRQALYDVANFWIEKGAGGFRMDAIPYIKKPADFSDGPADGEDGLCDIHKMTVNTDGILDFLREFKKEVTEGKDVFTVGEANGVASDQLKYWVGKDGVFDMIFEFNHMNLEFDGVEIWCKSSDWKLSDLKKALTESQKATADNGWYPIYLENHDKPRSISHYFPSDADKVLTGRALGTILLTLRGTPFIYEGEELGFRNVAWDSIDAYDDLNSRSQYDIALNEGYSQKEALEFVHRFSRDNARTPMQWDDSDQAGFTTGQPWLPVHDDFKTENVSYEAADPASVLSWYRRLVAFRQENDVLIGGDYEEYLSESEQIYAFARKNSRDRLVILVNFTDSEVFYDPARINADTEKAEILMSSYEDSRDASQARVGTLRPFEAVIIR